jgi:hypothetical protein
MDGARNRATTVYTELSELGGDFIRDNLHC